MTDYQLPANLEWERRTAWQGYPAIAGPIALGVMVHGLITYYLSIGRSTLPDLLAFAVASGFFLYALGFIALLVLRRRTIARATLSPEGLVLHGGYGSTYEANWADRKCRIVLYDTSRASVADVMKSRRAPVGATTIVQVGPATAWVPPALATGIVSAARQAGLSFEDKTTGDGSEWPGIVTRISGSADPATLKSQGDMRPAAP